MTPLHKAAGNGHTEVVKALLAAGAGTDIADKVSRWLAAPTIGERRAERRGGGNGSNGGFDRAADE